MICSEQELEELTYVRNRLSSTVTLLSELELSVDRYTLAKVIEVSKRVHESYEWTLRAVAEARTK